MAGKKRPREDSKQLNTKKLKWGGGDILDTDSIDDLKSALEKGRINTVSALLKQKLDKKLVQELIESKISGSENYYLQYFFRAINEQTKKNQYDGESFKEVLNQLFEISFWKTGSAFYSHSIRLQFSDKPSNYEDYLIKDFKEAAVEFKKKHNIVDYLDAFRAKKAQEKAANTEEKDQNTETKEQPTSSEDQVNTKTVINSESSQNDNLLSETQAKSDGYQAVKTNTLLPQVKEPNIVLLELISELDKPKVANKEEQEYDRSRGEIEKTLQDQVVKVVISEYVNSINQTLWNSYGMIYKPDSIEDIVELPSQVSITSDPLVFLGVFPLEQKYPGLME